MGWISSHAGPFSASWGENRAGTEGSRQGEKQRAPTKEELLAQVHRPGSLSASPAGRCGGPRAEPRRRARALRRRRGPGLRAGGHRGGGIEGGGGSGCRCLPAGRVITGHLHRDGDGVRTGVGIGMRMGMKMGIGMRMRVRMGVRMEMRMGMEMGHSCIPLQKGVGKEGNATHPGGQDPHHGAPRTPLIRGTTHPCPHAE